MDFIKFKHAVALKFAEMAKHDLFVTGNQDDMFETYLASFPAGSNPMFRERTEHDCSCCKSFVRKMGNVVAIIDGQITSIWDTKIDEPAYQVVADAMARTARSMPIVNEFRHYEGSAGTDKTFEEITGKVTTWSHFHAKIPSKFVCMSKDIDTVLSRSRADRDVLFRSLTELTIDAVDTVIDLIAQGSLYRGAEHKATLLTFRKLQAEFKTLTEDRRNAFVWMSIKKTPGSVTRIRNTAIGTLLIDLSAGVELEIAVRKFEAVVAPTNYKRTTALVTPAMVAKAKAKIEELGYTPALERRYAMLPDIAIDNIIFANRDVRKALNADVFDDIQTKVPKRNLDKVEEIGIERFLSDILPKADAIEVMLENKHQNNLVSLIAPVDPAAPSMFKWDNSFSWSYNGDMADSIKERVKKAGGNVTGDLCCRLAWYNHDDLDFHMYGPDKQHIYYGNRRAMHGGGNLDVDMNNGNLTRTPVENIFYPSRQNMVEGVYRLQVNQFSKRETTNVGFEVEIDFQGQLWNFVYDKAVRSTDNILVAEFKYSHAKGVEMIKSMPSTVATRKIWGLDTQKFHPVSVAMLSPNYWADRGVGNKHYFFMLDGCINDGQARGFFNEFLKGELDEHRKVIEIVGSKMKTEASPNQLSGLGFSDTQRAELVVNVKGSFNRTVKVII